MRDLSYLDKYRVYLSDLYGNLGDSKNGAFKVYVEGKSFFVIASSGGGWEHVSVHPKNQKRCPTWEEMCAVKDMFFELEEVVMQLHPAHSEYVSNHPYCLHLWRPLEREIPLPPVKFV